MAIEDESAGASDGFGIAGDGGVAGEEEAESSLEFGGIADGWLAGRGLSLERGEEEEGQVKTRHAAA